MIFSFASILLFQHLLFTWLIGHLNALSIIILDMWNGNTLELKKIYICINMTNKNGLKEEYYHPNINNN
jgi:hypothetical protein